MKKFMSQSMIQKTQVYNLFRNRVYLFFAQRLIHKQKEEHNQALAAQRLTKESDFYIKLLTLFSKELNADGVTLIMISVNNQLDQYPEIKRCLKQLESAGQLKFYCVQAWLEGVLNYGSPEGHLWGRLAHKIIGEKLSLIIKNFDNDRLKLKN
jgi:hypothetical protein